MLILTILFSTLLTYSLPNNTFVLDNPPSEICDNKSIVFKIQSNSEHVCGDFSSVEWYIRSDQTRPYWGSSLHQGKEFNFTPNFGTTSRSIDLKAQIECLVYIGDDQNGDPIYEPRTFSDVVTIKIVHPDFFQLSLIEQPSCKANSYSFQLSDPSGTLDNNNLDNISWTIPTGWSISSSGTTSTVIVNTNGNNDGKKKVKVKFEAIATKIVNTTPEKKKCIASREIEAELDVSSCMPQISYPPKVANHPSSHSSSQTFFGATSLVPGYYSFASGGRHELSTGFDFSASSNSSLYLFIEDCNCNSEWHDPNLLGNASVDINNPFIVTNKNVDDTQRKKIIDNEIKEENASIYPNPFESKITIVNLLINQEVPISISTIDQKRVLVQNEKVKDTGSIELQLEHLLPGIYIVQIITDGELKTWKIIKK